MTVKSKYRGHGMELVWIYSDNKNPVSSDKDRACGHCNQPNTAEGHDACLGTLKNAMNACCGHGNLAEAFVQLPNGFSIKGLNTLIIIELLTDHTPCQKKRTL